MAEQRIYRTTDGRHVPEGHEEAAFLAYSQYDEVPDEVADELKQGRKPANKQAARPADKQAGRRSRKTGDAESAGSDE